MYALVVLCLIGQVDPMYQPLPPPPLPSRTIPPNAPPEPYRQPYNSERDWLTNNLIVDHPALEKQIRYKMSSLSDKQVHQLANYYRQQVALAKIQLQQAIEQRNRLRQELEDRVRAEEQRITEYGSDLASQQFEWALQNALYNYGGYAPYYHNYGYVPRYYVPRYYVSSNRSNGRLNSSKPHRR
jgi:hypothetical protein